MKVSAVAVNEKASAAASLLELLSEEEGEVLSPPLTPSAYGANYRGLRAGAGVSEPEIGSAYGSTPRRLTRLTPQKPAEDDEFDFFKKPSRVAANPVEEARRRLATKVQGALDMLVRVENGQEATQAAESIAAMSLVQLA
mmetsp:Transcript_22007/g.24447  ORF Transcript_22007/g.24447 Transcript_22007/m.24447 type:complete len:140 (+) Transcript_22007:139-558(+)